MKKGNTFFSFLFIYLRISIKIMNNKQYKLINVYGGNISGHRESNVVVDIGYGSRKYWAYTNEYGQLIKVIAEEIILQDESSECVNLKGRYYNEEAKVSGVEREDLDEGHVIADSLGGVSNAYNITPQNSILNRYGDQAYMEKIIRDAGGCKDFVAIITYPNTTTQIPSHYSFTYNINGNIIKDEFDNLDPNSIKQTITDNENIVYWTPKGKSYHSTNKCSSLSRSKTILEGTLSQSKKKDPCNRCN